MPKANVKCPDLARRLSHAREHRYQTYDRMCERFLNDAEFIAEHKVIDPATVSRWIKSGSFPEGIVRILLRILSEDRVPDCLAEERKAFQQIEPIGMIECQKQIIGLFLELANQHPEAVIDFYVVPAHLRSTVAWLEEVVRNDMAHRIGTIKLKTMRPDFLLSLVDLELVNPDHLESFASNFHTVRDTLKRYGRSGSDIAVIGHFPRIPPFHVTIVGVEAERYAAWGERWEADDDGRLGIDTSWIRPIFPQPPTQRLFDRLTSVFDRVDVPAMPGCAEPPSRSLSDWKKAIAAAHPAQPAAPRRRSRD